MDFKITIKAQEAVQKATEASRGNSSRLPKRPFAEGPLPERRKRLLVSGLLGANLTILTPRLDALWPPTPA
jgi:hypothetical protein